MHETTPTAAIPAAPFSGETLHAVTVQVPEGVLIWLMHQALGNSRKVEQEIVARLETRCRCCHRTKAATS